MTECSDAEISRRLALAIGWPEEAFYKGGDGSFVALALLHSGGCSWKEFDYRDPAVIWQIAERFDCFPTFHAVSDTWAVGLGQWMAHEDCDTAAKAVALAVIKAKEQT